MLLLIRRMLSSEWNSFPRALAFLHCGYNALTMSGYYISIHLKTNSPAQVKDAVTDVFTDAGFQFLSDEPASAVVRDEDLLPDGDHWYGVLVSGQTKRGWVSVYVDDWADSGLLAKALSSSLGVPLLEVWVADDIHWGYTYYENGTVEDRFADAPTEVADTADEAALYGGSAEALLPILQVPPAQFAQTLQDARAHAGQFAGGPLDAVALAVGIPFEHLFTGYDYFFSDDPEDYSQDLEDWPAFRHLAFQIPKGRETLAE